MTTALIGLSPGAFIFCISSTVPRAISPSKIAMPFISENSIGFQSKVLPEINPRLGSFVERNSF
jgi:hypothetical protein